jgi:hypothetical protein
MKRGRAYFSCLLFVLAGALGLLPASAAELTIGVVNPPAPLLTCAIR